MQLQGSWPSCSLGGKTVLQFLSAPPKKPDKTKTAGTTSLVPFPLLVRPVSLSLPTNLSVARYKHLNLPACVYSLQLLGMNFWKANSCFPILAAVWISLWWRLRGGCSVFKSTVGAPLFVPDISTRAPCLPLCSTAVPRDIASSRWTSTNLLIPVNVQHVHRIRLGFFGEKLWGKMLHAFYFSAGILLSISFHRCFRGI